ncbi:MAG TPA: c-type cytochrome, partial [Gemmatimonadales bacterium]|nr:c-type cytochrome [Gemmatimonadales bacterium]
MLSVCGAAAAAAQANDSLAVARRVVAATSLAAKEYATGVAPGGGRVMAAAEVDEAKQFLDGARADVGRLPAAVRAPTESALVALRALIDRAAPPDSVAQRAATIVQRIAAAAGGALDPFPPAPPSLVRGARVFREQCVPCHGLTGRGDGPKAAHLT